MLLDAVVVCSPQFVVTSTGGRRPTWVSFRWSRLEVFYPLTSGLSSCFAPTAPDAPDTEMDESIRILGIRVGTPLAGKHVKVVAAPAECS